MRHPRARTHVDHPNAGQRHERAKLRRKVLRHGFPKVTRAEAKEMFGK